jgi:hypothetical protein
MASATLVPPVVLLELRCRVRLSNFRSGVSFFPKLSPDDFLPSEFERGEQFDVGAGEWSRRRNQKHRLSDGWPRSLRSCLLSPEPEGCSTKLRFRSLGTSWRGKSGMEAVGGRQALSWSSLITQRGG